MAIRAMSFSTPWGKKNSSDRDFAFLCITAAVHHNPKSTELLKQLKLIKSTILNPSAGPNIITTRATHKCAAQLSELSTDYKKIYPANIKANNKPTISFFAGKNDHFLLTLKDLIITCLRLTSPGSNGETDIWLKPHDSLKNVR
jgi:hypothetical protein